MKAVTTFLCALALAVSGLAVASGGSPALAQPTAGGPADGARIPSNSQSFSWGETGVEGGTASYYVEISTMPNVAYYSYGEFQGPLVFALGGLTSRSLNLNALGRALPAGTYYWHVAGKYGAYGINGTSWSAVRSFVVYDTAVVAPRIAVSPSTMTFTVTSGTSGVQVALAQDFTIGNTGGGTLNFQFAPHTGGSWLLDTACTNVGGVCNAQATVDPTGLGVGDYTMNLDVWDNGSVPAAVGGSKTIAVTLHVVASDSLPPTGSQITAPATSRTGDVTLTLAAADSGVGMGQMRFQNDAGAWSEWEPFATTKHWVLPPAQGAHTVHAQFRDTLQNTATPVSTSVFVDTVAPTATVLTAPAVSTSRAASSAVVLNWTTATDAAPSSGLAGYRIGYRALPTAAWTAWGGVRGGLTAAFPGAPGTTYQFRIQAVDVAGNGSPWAVRQVVVPWDQVSAAYAGAWTTVARTPAYRGSVRRTVARNATSTIAKPARVVGLVVTKGRAYGKARVYVDGVLAATIDTYAASTAYRQYVAIKTFATVGTHTVKVVNLATAGRPALELDGFALSR